MTVSELCQSCALCCSGALFRYAVLTDAEVARLEARGVPTSVRRNGELALRLGCEGLQGTRCGLYDARPFACDDFFCLLAFRLRDGLVSPEDATRTVREAQALLAEMEGQLPPKAGDDPPSIIERAHQYGLASGPELLRRTEAFLREHFLGPRH